MGGEIELEFWPRLLKEGASHPLSNIRSKDLLFRNDEEPKVNNFLGGIQSARQFPGGLQRLKKYIDWLIDRVVEGFYSVILGLELLGSDFAVNAK